ncbi:DMP19 family protein [Sphingomonas sp. Tas61C01]|uniref:DMP19 family protein n=1 Tax=Sphingomonas sp. Tas61C01 TaxID=3458297 RepID=UPI00403EE854
MIDTRPLMTEREFAEAAAYVHPRSWMTGESLVHVGSVMDVEGWNFFGHPGNQQLTPAQRTLMMWSDVIGQVCNGGFTQFCENFAANLSEAVNAVDALDWPDLRDRFRRAMTEQAGDADSPCLIRPVPREDEPDKWQASRARLIRHLARREKRWWQWIGASDLAQVEASHPDWLLEWRYREAVEAGEIPSGGERFLDFIDPPQVEADAFGDWFYEDETKAASCDFVHAFILKSRDQLYRSA